MRQLISKNNGERVLDEVNETGRISENSRKHLVSILCSYAMEVGVNKPSKQQRKDIIRGIITIAPCLGDENAQTEIVRI